MGFLNIFSIFAKSNNKPKSNPNPLEEERLNKISNSKSTLYRSVFENVSDSIKRDYVNNEKCSYVSVNTYDLDMIKLDNDTIHQIALKAIYDAASKLEIKIRPHLHISYPSIQIRIYYE